MRERIKAVVAGFVLGLVAVALAIGAVGCQFFGGLILLCMVPLPVFMAGLGWGTLSAFLASVSAIVCIGGAFSWSYYTALISLLVVLASSLAQAAVIRRSIAVTGTTREDWLSPGGLAVVLVALGMIMIIALATLLSDTQGDMYDATLSLLNKFISRAETPEVASVIGVIAAQPALAIVVLLGLMLVNGALAQGVLARFNWALRSSPGVVDLHLPPWYIWAALSIDLAALAVLYSPEAGRVGFVLNGLALIASFGLFIAGLAVVHTWSLGFRRRGRFLCGFYVTLATIAGFFGMAWPLLLLALAGFMDQVLNIRGRLRSIQDALQS